MPDIPLQDIIRRVKQIKQCYGQLDHTEGGTKVAASQRNCIDGLDTKLVNQLFQFSWCEFAQIRRIRNSVKVGGRNFPVQLNYSLSSDGSVNNHQIHAAFSLPSQTAAVVP